MIETLLEELKSHFWRLSFGLDGSWWIAQGSTYPGKDYIDLQANGHTPKEALENLKEQLTEIGKI